MERADFADVERALECEWLETDGCGGFASSTVLSCPTRRYHGLLVTAPPGTARRHTFLARLDEVLVEGGREIALSTARHSGGFAPEGHRSLERFELAPHPCSVHRIGDAEVTREVTMVRGRPVVLVRFTADGLDGDVELRLRPFLACREADALTFENDVLDPSVERVEHGIRCRPYASLPAVSITLSSGHDFVLDPVWYRGLEYGADLARGYDGHEDQFAPGVLRAHLTGGELVLAATIGPAVSDPAALWREAVRRRPLPARVTPRARLELAADDFLYRDPAGRLGVIAGFPWFVEWGRDTFLSLPGLTLARGRTEECGEALSGAVAFLDGGLLPNVFGTDRESSDYGSADAALWFARAVLLYARAGGDRDRIARELVPALIEIAEAYQRGAELGLEVDDDGLLRAGRVDLNPTWMDAVTSRGPVTPRHGYAVEIQALWYSLLRTIEALSEDVHPHWTRLADSVGAAFLERFWLEDERRLADVVRDDGVVDRAVRPNMVLAAALEKSPLSGSQRADVVRVAKTDLVTPRGLRTLSPRHPEYRGRYSGGPEERDAAYHQGTVWPWLLGPYCEATLRAHGRTRTLVAELRALLDGLNVELDSTGLGHVSEVFDGEPPHRAGGTIAQAWSTAELLRAHALLDGGAA